MRKAGKAILWVSCLPALKLYDPPGPRQPEGLADVGLAYLSCPNARRAPELSSTRGCRLRDDVVYARMSLTTRPCTSVSRKSRPEYR